MNLIFISSSILIFLLSLTVGILRNGILGRAGFYRWLAERWPNDQFVGMIPANLVGVEPSYSYETHALLDLTGQRVLLTGGNAGLGFVMARELVRRGADVIMACRDLARCADAAREIERELSNDAGKKEGGSVVCSNLPLDTSVLSSVRRFALGFEGHVDVLMLNAGFGGDVPQGTVSADGICLTFATNYLGHALLYDLLLPRMLRTAEETPVRVVVTSSSAHWLAPRFGVGLSKEQLLESKRLVNYGQSNLARILFAKEATRRLDLLDSPAARNIFFNAFHPGLAKTKIWSRALRWLEVRPLLYFVHELVRWFYECMFTPEEAALTGLYLAAAPQVVENKFRGKYFHPIAQQVEPNAKHANNMTLQVGLWEFAHDLIEEVRAKEYWS